MPLDPDSTKAVADQLADAIAPRAVGHLKDNWDEVVGAVQNGPARFVLRHNQGAALGLVPPLAKVGAEVALEQFAGLSIGDLAQVVARHAADKGLGIHPSVAKFALAASGSEPPKSEFQRMGDRVKGS